MTDPRADLERRTLLRAAALSGVAVPLLVACGDETAVTGRPGPTGDDTRDDAVVLTGAADVPVGGGVILAREKVVVTEPRRGEFQPFTAACTHQGCLVGRVESHEIVCPCHGSTYSIDDGSNIAGPAPSPLDEVAISVEGDRITRG